jgi:hypothetical protein
VHPLYGSATGLGTARDQLWHQGSSGIFGAPGADSFGRALANGVGDG